LPTLFVQLEPQSVDAYSRVLVYGKTVYKQADLHIAATAPLPALDPLGANNEFALYAGSLEGAPRIALTEAGVVGSTVPEDHILDMVGLNDREIALHGPTTDYIFSQHPDIIWMPHTSYTWLRGELFSDPRLLERYDVYAGAFNYGVAIRKDAPDAQSYRAELATIWARFYPDTNPEAYRVLSVSWDQTPQRL
jgi:hypothetical protein